MGFCEKDFLWNPSKRDYQCNKAYKIDEFLDITNCYCEKHLIGKLLVEYEDEILSATKTLLNTKT